MSCDEERVEPGSLTWAWQSCDNKGRQYGMQNDRKNEGSVNMGLVLLQGRTIRLSSTPNLQYYCHGLRSNTVTISHITCRRRIVLCIMVNQTPRHAIYMAGLATFMKYLLGPLPHLKHGCASLCMAQLVLHLIHLRLGHSVVQSSSVVASETMY